MSWDAADVRMIIDEVGRWRARALDPQVSNWAQCMTAPVLSGLMAQLTEIGVLSEEMGLDPDVPGLWRDLTDPQAIALGTGILSELGQGNAALALACHRRALAQWLLNQMREPLGAVLLPGTTVWPSTAWVAGCQVRRCSPMTPPSCLTGWTVTPMTPSSGAHTAGSSWCGLSGARARCNGRACCAPT